LTDGRHPAWTEESRFRGALDDVIIIPLVVVTLATTGLNASAGISYNKFLAKLASDHRKPNGQFVISPEMGPAFVETLPVGKFHGIGPATGAKMNALGLFTGLDIRNQTLEFMNANFGKSGAYYYWISRGVDERPVRANRIRKSIGAETTFSTDLFEFNALVIELRSLVDKVWRHCETTGSRGRTVTLKIKFADFEIITRSRSLLAPVAGRDELERLACEALARLREGKLVGAAVERP
jgi:DNA polymerase-4